jgi:anti-sigma B factor antagonist
MPFTVIPAGYVFRVKGELDLATVNILERALAEHIQQGQPITLDLSGMSFIDVSGLHAFKRIADALVADGWCLLLHRVSAAHQSVISLVGLDRVENIHVMPCDVAAA